MNDKPSSKKQEKNENLAVSCNLMYIEDVAIHYLHKESYSFVRCVLPCTTTSIALWRSEAADLGVRALRASLPGPARRCRANLPGRDW